MISLETAAFDDPIATQDLYLGYAARARSPMTQGIAAMTARTDLVLGFVGGNAD